MTSYNNVDQSIYAVAPDGAGGWYIGGSFNYVGMNARKCIARIKADGTVHPWNPLVDNTVRAIAVRGNRVFIGGDFTQVNGTSINYIAAIDANSGNLDLSWNPNIDPPANVMAILIYNDTVIFGGYFTTLK